MKLLIRADANKDIAMGHVMRCLSIADAFSDLGWDVVWVQASDDSKELINNRGYETIILNTDYRDMMSEFDIFDGFTADLILIDSYFVTNEYFKRMRNFGPTAYMDDFGKDAFLTDILINYNLYAGSIDYEALYAKQSAKLPIMLLGTSYVPLRRFYKFAQPKALTCTPPFNVLVSTGGADACHMAVNIARRFTSGQNETLFNQVVLNILVGPFSTDNKELEQISSKYPTKVILHRNITQMADFLSKFDMAVSASGSTTYELCAMGVPTVLFASADNQYMNLNSAKENGLIATAGFANIDLNSTIDCIFEWFEKICANPSILASLRKDALSVCDTKGAERLASELANSVASRL